MRERGDATRRFLQEQACCMACRAVSWHETLGGPASCLAHKTWPPDLPTRCAPCAGEQAYGGPRQGGERVREPATIGERRVKIRLMLKILSTQVSSVPQSIVIPRYFLSTVVEKRRASSLLSSPRKISCWLLRV